MRHIKTYQIFEASASAPAALTQEQIDWLNSCTAGSWKLNPTTRLIDVDGDFDCSSESLTDLKGIKFGEVSGVFYCRNNRLTSLEGAPQSVGGGFDCRSNQLTSLEGAPQSVGINFYCRNNLLTSLEGAPQSVGGSFYCENNLLTSLEGAPQSVVRDFYCNDNPVSEETLASIFALMKKGKSYQQALEEHWPKMNSDDRALMYKQMPNLPPEDERKYNALAKYNNIKGYL